MKLTDKELLDLIYRKGVAVGFILMMEEGHMGVQEYNDFIGAKKLYLTEEEYTAIAAYGKKGKKQDESNFN